MRLVVGAAAMGVLLLLRSRPFRVEVAGVSMHPLLDPGDYLVATKAGLIRRGALVVVERPGGQPGEPTFEVVKRVAGLPGDRIDGRFLRSAEYWVVGDSVDRSTDSRTFGPVTRQDIEGVVRLRYWPLSRLRVFTSKR